MHKAFKLQNNTGIYERWGSELMKRFLFPQL